MMIMMLLFASGCGGSSSSGSSGSSNQSKTEGEVQTEMHMMIDGVNVAVEWENNESVNALKDSLPLSVNMHMYGGFEQVASLGKSLPGNDSRITTSAGDIVLYSGNQIVIFYGSNTWAYTKLGRITDKSESELKALLGEKDVTLTISAE